MDPDAMLLGLLAVFVLVVFASGVWSERVWRRKKALWRGGSFPRSDNGVITFAFAAGCVSLLAAANPWEPGQKNRSSPRLVAVVDTSLSMLATDLKPSRFGYIQEQLTARLEGLNGPAGLVSVAGTARVECPLTTDLVAFDELLQRLSPRRQPVGGTDLAAGVELALEHIPEQAQASAEIWLLSDGEDHAAEASRWQRVFEEARRRDIPVHTVFCASKRESPIVWQTSGAGTTLRDEEGEPVLSRGQPDLLRRIAWKTGGSFFDSRFLPSAEHSPQHRTGSAASTLLAVIGAGFLLFVQFLRGRP